MRKWRKTAAIPAGIVLFFILGRMAIPGPVPGTELSMQFGVLAVLSAWLGSAAGGLIGLFGQLLLDLSTGGIIWSRTLPSALYGVLAGQLAGGLRMENGELSGKDVLVFIGFQLAAHAAAWFLAAPCLSILIDATPVSEAFRQGLFTGITHMITTVIIGTVLCLAVTTIWPGGSRMKRD